MKFVYPVEGSALTDASGKLLPDGRLMTEVAVEAAAPVTVCGVEAVKNADGLWTAEVALAEGRTRITAVSGDETQEITVFRAPEATGKYALSVDDNIWWLAELTTGNYASLFDHPYLAVYKRAHEQYGAKVRLNIFYEIAPVTQLKNGQASDKYGDFNLSRMTDRYKAEFGQNADWLHLAFHARRELPPEPYRYATYEQVKEDCEAVEREILRFAGEKTLEKYATTVHYGVCSPDGVRALKDLGYRALMGYMSLTETGDPFVSYNLTGDEVAGMQRYAFWKCPSDGMIYGKIPVVLNLYSPERIRELLDEEYRLWPERGFVEIMIHEQYFYEDYISYEPDFEERVMAGCAWCHEKGLKGAFTQDVLPDIAE